MPIRLPPGSLATALCRPEECKGCDAVTTIERDPYVARLVLSPLLRDGMAMANLRADWLPVSGDQALSRLDDQQLLDAIGGALATGRLRLCPGTVAAEGEAGAEDGNDAKAKAAAAAESEGERQAMPTSASAPSPPPRPVAPAPPTAAAPPPPAPPPVVEIEIDAAAMTAVLLAAARDGVPFCEECEKARKEREAQPA